MKIWYFWEGNLTSDEPEAYETRRLLEVGRARGHDVQVYSPNQFKFLIGCDGTQNIFVDGNPTPYPDIVVPRLGSASSYLCFSILRHLERNNVIVVSPSAAIDLASDKLQTMQILAQKKIPIPKTMFARCPVDSSIITSQIGYPVVVKTLRGTQGGGVYLSETTESLRNLSELLASQGFDTSPVLFQEFIKTSHGRDIRAFCVGGKVVACMQRKSTDGSFKSNITRGGVGEPVEITPEMEKISLDTSNALGLEIAGIDLLYTEDGFKVCEANSSPGFKGLEKFCKVDAADAIYNYLETRYTKEKKQEGNVVQAFFGKLFKGRNNAA